KRMSTLVNDLLEYSRVGNKGLEPQSVNPGELLEETLALLAKDIEESGARITIADMPAIHADRMQLAQVFKNLISNAVKFRRDGVLPEIAIGARREADAWVLWVRDNGI